MEYANISEVCEKINSKEFCSETLANKVWVLFNPRTSMGIQVGFVHGKGGLRACTATKKKVEATAEIIANAVNGKIDSSHWHTVDCIFVRR